MDNWQHLGISLTISVRSRLHGSCDGSCWEDRGCCVLEFGSRGKDWQVFLKTWAFMVSFLWQEISESPGEKLFQWVKLTNSRLHVFRNEIIFPAAFFPPVFNVIIHKSCFWGTGNSSGAGGEHSPASCVLHRAGPQTTLTTYFVYPVGNPGLLNVAFGGGSSMTSPEARPSVHLQKMGTCIAFPRYPDHWLEGVHLQKIL